jgi:NTE family protein
MEISIALGGGGVRGGAHIGVLRRLEADGYQIKALAGTSAGGLVGAVYAAGYSCSEILARFQQVDQMHLFGSRHVEGPAILGTAGIHGVMEEMLGETTFEDLKIPFAVTAVDIHSGKEVILSEGRVVDALMATIALPGVFPPQVWGEYYLVDGGVLDPVPVLPARSLAPLLPVVAVVLTRANEELDRPSFLPQGPQILQRVARLRLAQALSLFLQSVDIGSRAIAELRLKIDKPDVIIRPNMHDIGFLDPVDIVEVAAYGESAAGKALPDLERATRWSNQLARRLRYGRLQTIQKADPDA